MFRDRRSQLYLTVVCFMIGLLVVMQLRTQNRIAKGPPVENPADQAVFVANLVEANAQLDQEVAQLESKLQEYQRASGSTDLQVLVQDLNRLKMINGLVEVQGPGIELIVDGKLAATDMQDLINELRNAGAEGLALNGHRVIYRTVITSGQGGLMLDGVELTEPYVLRAVGKAETLERAIERKGGLVPLLRYHHPDWVITTSQKQSIKLPLYDGPLMFGNAQVAKP